MTQKYKVFLNDRYVLLTTKWSKKLILNDSFLATQTNNLKEIKDVFKLFSSSPEIKKLVLINDDVEKLFKTFKKMFIEVEAAGGLVQNERGEYLMIHRRGFWDLPKGKLDDGENLKECAVREVEEECGLKHITRDKKICITYHIYETKKGLCIKPSHWYGMSVKGSPELIPQEEEDIEKAEWIKSKDVSKLLKTAFPSIKEVFKKVKINSKSS